MIARTTRIFYFYDTRKDFKNHFLDTLKTLIELELLDFFTLTT
jgi:hypothetical protein